MIEYRDMIQNNSGINVVALNMRILNILLNLYSRMTFRNYSYYTHIWQPLVYTYIIIVHNHSNVFIFGTNSLNIIMGSVR